MNYGSPKRQAYAIGRRIRTATSMNAGIDAVGASEPHPLSHSVNVMVSSLFWSKSLSVGWSVVACGLEQQEAAELDLQPFSSFR
jgi:hypothetical protein